MISQTFINGDAMYDAWRHDILHGLPPKHYDLGGDGFNHLRLGPGTVSLIGGAPGMGKTTFAMQCVFKAMAADPSLSVCVANVEMPPERLLERQLSRLSHVRLDDIQNRQLTSVDKQRLEQAFESLRSIMGRLVFVKAPFTIENVAFASDSVDAELLVLDYIQRIHPDGRFDDKRGSIDATMDSIRKCADDGRCVLALSAVGRSKDKKGRSTYAGDTLTLASYRESSELEYGTDDAFLLVPAEDADEDFASSTISVTLKQLKCRYGKPIDCDLFFDRQFQSFRPKRSETSGASRIKKSLQRMVENK
jgi:replicative DNA helicase